MIDIYNPWFLTLFGYSVAVFLFDHYIDRRQLRNFQSAKSMPAELKGSVVTEETFKKSTVYGKDKLQFGIFEGFAMFTEGSILTVLGVSDSTNCSCNSVTNILLVLLYILLLILLLIPLLIHY
jgi:hypothetical protein